MGSPVGPSAIRRSRTGSAASRPRWAGPPGGSSCWATTPTTTAGWSCRRPSTARRSSSAAGVRGLEGRFESLNFGQGDAFPLDAIEPHRGRDLVPVHPRRLLGALGVGRAAGFGVRGRHPRRCPARGRAVELGEPPGVGRLVPDPARAGAAPPARRLHARRGRPAPHGAGHDPEALGERVRRGRLGSARPVLEPLRPGRSRPVPRLRDAGPRPAARWDTPRRRSSCATRRPRDGWPTGCTTRGGRSASAWWPPSATGSPIAASSGSRGSRSSSSRPTGTPSTRSAASRARHVLSENERVRRGIEALKAGDVVAFGRLMSASHASSRDDFENSSPAPRRDDRGGRGRPRLPGRQALGRRLGRLHGQPGLGRSRRRRSPRPSGRITPARPGSLPRSTSAAPPTAPSGATSTVP